MSTLTDETIEENVVPGTHQHINPDGVTDAERGAQLGGVGGALTGIAAGAMLGPAGALLGAAVGGVTGALAGGLAVAAVDAVDDDGTNSDSAPVLLDDPDALIIDPDVPMIRTTDALVATEEREFTRPLPVPNDTNGTTDLRSVLEKSAETPTGTDPKLKTQKRDG